MSVEIPALPITMGQLRDVLVALEGVIGSGVVIPPLPLTLVQVRAILVELEAAVESGITIPELPMNGQQLRAVLVAVEGASRGVVIGDGLEPLPPASWPAPAAEGGRLLSGQAPPVVGDGVNGDVWLELSGDGYLAVWGPKTAGDWGLVPVFSWEGGLQTPPPRRLLLENPRVPDPWDLDEMPEERTISRVSASVRGTGGPSLTFTLRHGPTPGVGGTEVVTGGITVTDQVVVTVFDAATIAEGDWLWFDALAISGVVEKVSVGVEYA